MLEAKGRQCLTMSLSNCILSSCIVTWMVPTAARVASGALGSTRPWREVERRLNIGEMLRWSGVVEMNSATC